MPTQRPPLTLAQRRTIGVVAFGALAIAAIGFAGSYAAVRDLSARKGFGWFANVLPLGVDVGIAVLLALDLVLTWLRIPFPLLRPTAWLLTAATIAFNAATAWPDALGVGMHAVIPVLFIIVTEAARHATGRIADITADRHMESVRLARWLLAPIPTFRLWRRMKLWELRSYDDVIRMEQDRLTYRAHLRARYGAHWRRKAPVEALLPLRLARWGAPLHPAATDAAPEPVATDVALDPATDAALEPAATDVALNPAALAEPSATRAAVGRICSSGVQRLTVPQRTAAPAKRTAAPAKRAATSGGAAPVKPAAQASAAPQQRSDADAAFTRHADQALVLAGMSKAAAIRALHAAHPEESAPQLVQRLALHGIAAKDSSVRAELARDRQRREAAAAADTEPEPSSGTGHYM